MKEKRELKITIDIDFERLYGKKQSDSIKEILKNFIPKHFDEKVYEKVVISAIIITPEYLLRLDQFKFSPTENPPPACLQILISAFNKDIEECYIMEILTFLYTQSSNYRPGSRIKKIEKISDWIYI